MSSCNRRTFLGLVGAGAATAIMPRARAKPRANMFKSKRVVVVGIAGGLRLGESLGMAEGATMPNLLGRVPLVPGFGAGDAGPVRIAPEYLANSPTLVVPAARTTPLMAQGALVTNLRYADGAPGHLQGQACLISGAYNNIENRSDAHAPAPTLFEWHRRSSNAAATDAWYVSVAGGFYRALQSSAHPEFGPRFGGSFVSPPSLFSPTIPIATSGQRSHRFTADDPGLPTVSDPPDEAAAVRRLSAILDTNTRPYDDAATVFRSTPSENAAVEAHLESFYANPDYQAYYPRAVGIGLANPDGSLNGTGDAQTIYHAERILTKFKPAIMVITLLDVDVCHDDFNGYLRGQVAADACVRHLWDMIQGTPGLKDETTLLIVPEHGRHLFPNGQNPDSLGRSGVDHGQGDDGDRDVFLFALGPDIAPGQVIARTNVAQEGRASGRYESIDIAMTAATLLGHGDTMAATLKSLGMRPGIVVQELLR